ncbi:uncharacterized protein LOC113291163 [Papaver somniferum]|uniref:uncharacterized protein LOC113291163 n=1 Tax=Papaver somniferum TaxID=3469 RepID=UPI000E6F9419|nr:uncharacterized protein LOC113291163 [Papaver somniferum]
MSPFQSLYGYLPPHLAFPSSATTSVAAIEDYMKQRDDVLDILKDTLHKSQERMKFFADKTKTDSVQAYVALRRNLKLASKYYGPFTIIQKVGAAAYKLQLPAEARIHPVFHVSQLKKHIGITHIPSPSLPVLDTDGSILVIPAAALDSRTILRNGFYVPQLLIRWTSASVEDATWKDAAHIAHHFPKFHP